MSDITKNKGLLPIFPEGLYRWDSFCDRVPLSRQSWYLRIKEGRAPKPVEVGPRCSAWKGSDLLEWLKNPSEYVANKHGDGK